MAVDADDLRALLARGFADTATAHNRKLGAALRFDLADTALAVFDDGAQAKLLADMMERTRIRSMDFRRGVAMDIDAAEEITAAFVAAARAMLGEAPNYSETPFEYEVKVAESPETYVYVLTVQRAGRPTPHQMRQRAEAERDAFAAEVLIARSLRIMPRSLDGLIDRDVHTPARVRAYLAAHGWELREQYPHISEWHHDGVGKLPHHDQKDRGAVVMVVDRPGGDYTRRMVELVVDLASLHRTGELQVLHDIEEAPDA